MPLFAFKAVDDYGHYQKGVVFKENIDDVYGHLKMRMWNAITIRKKTAYFGMHPTHHDWCNFFSKMEKLIDQFPLTTCLNIVEHQAIPNALKYMILRLFNELQNGVKLSTFLGEKDFKIPDAVVSFFQYAETQGSYAAAFSRAKTYYSWKENIAQRVKNQLYYPMVLGGITIILVGVFAYVVLPTIEPIINESQSGNILFQLLTFLRNLDPLMVFIFMMILIVSTLILRYTRIGFFLRKLSQLEIIFFAKDLEFLLLSQIPLRESLIIIQKKAPPKLQNVIQNINAGLSSGKKLSTCLSSEEELPSLLVSLVEIGEKTATLASAFGNFSYIAYADYQQKLERNIALIQPVSIVIMGSIMISLILGIISPLYDLMLKGNIINA
jgi:type II secretory pathway component PulF